MEILIPAEGIQQRVKELAGRIAVDYRGLPLTIVGVLTGSLMFVADLVRHLELSLRLGFIQASSYRGAVTTPGDLRVDPALLPDLAGRHVLLLDDILDTGNTLATLTDRTCEVRSRSGVAEGRGVVTQTGTAAATVRAGLLYGFEIPDAFVVGYGLDYNDEYRHLPSLAVLTPDEIA